MKLLFDISELKHISRQDQQESRNSHYGANESNTRTDVGYHIRQNMPYQAQNDDGRPAQEATTINFVLPQIQPRNTRSQLLDYQNTSRKNTMEYPCEDGGRTGNGGGGSRKENSLDEIK